MSPRESERDVRFTVTIRRRARADVYARRYKVVGEHQYGYVEDRETQDVDETMYEQTVEELNVATVIAAVNGTSASPLLRFVPNEVSR